MTPAEIRRVIDGRAQARQDAHDRDCYLAWLHGLYARAAYHAKRYPEAPEPTRRREPGPVRAQSLEEKKAVLRGLARRGKGREHGR
jgi:hypothetical protein